MHTKLIVVCHGMVFIQCAKHRIIIIIIIIIIVLRPFSAQKCGLDDTNKLKLKVFMLDLILAKDIKNRMPFRFRCSGLFSYFPDHTGALPQG